MKPSNKPKGLASRLQGRDLVIAALAGSLATITASDCRDRMEERSAPRSEKAAKPVPKKEPGTKLYLEFEPYAEEAPSECVSEEVSRDEFDKMVGDSSRTVKLSVGDSCESISLSYKDRGKNEQEVKIEDYPQNMDATGIAESLCKDLKLNISDTVLNQEGQNGVELTFICGKSRSDVVKILIPEEGISL